MQAYGQEILEFLQRHQFATISTCDPDTNQPESALIAFTEDDDLCLYFQTGRHTRKAQNLKRNPKVSLVMGLTLEDMKTVQYEGVAALITTAEDMEVCKQRFVAKDSPTNEKYFNHPSAIFFKVTPTWIGCSDYTQPTPRVIEIKEFPA